MIFSGQWRASVCWFRHCCRNHFYLFTASASHDEAAFSPQWGLSIRVLPKTPKSGGNVARKKEKSGVFQPPHGRGARSVPGNYCQKSFCLWTLSIWFPPNMDFKYTRTWHFFPSESRFFKMTWLICKYFLKWQMICKYFLKWHKKEVLDVKKRAT